MLTIYGQLLEQLSIVPLSRSIIVFLQCYSSPLDYNCNSLLYGLPQSLIGKVQSVQNATARLLTGTRRRDHHISPVLL